MPKKRDTPIKSQVLQEPEKLIEVGEMAVKPEVIEPQLQGKLSTMDKAHSKKEAPLSQKVSDKAEKLSNKAKKVYAKPLVAVLIIGAAILGIAMIYLLFSMASSVMAILAGALILLTWWHINSRTAF